jgi:hypothetical protein
MARALSLKVPFNITSARISEYEHGTREPNMLTLLAYARLAGVPLEQIVDDNTPLFP